MVAVRVDPTKPAGITGLQRLVVLTLPQLSGLRVAARRVGTLMSAALPIDPRARGAGPARRRSGCATAVDAAVRARADRAGALRLPLHLQRPPLPRRRAGGRRARRGARDAGHLRCAGRCGRWRCSCRPGTSSSAARWCSRDAAAGGVLPTGAVLHDLADRARRRLEAAADHAAAGGRGRSAAGDPVPARAAGGRARGRGGPAQPLALRARRSARRSRWPRSSCSAPRSRRRGCGRASASAAWSCAGPAVRRPGGRPLTFRPTPGGPQRLVIGAAVLAVAGAGAAWLGPHLPGGGQHRVVLRNYVKPPFDVAAYPSPLVGFRKYTKDAKQLYDQTAVHGHGPARGRPAAHRHPRRLQRLGVGCDERHRAHRSGRAASTPSSGSARASPPRRRAAACRCG